MRTYDRTQSRDQLVSSRSGSGRFGNWLEENKDWSLSRDRYWGTPLPIWVAEDGSDMFIVGSIDELLDGFRLVDGNAFHRCGRNRSAQAVGG
jgi:isoleucyl-tRNA synthetase